MNGFKIRAAREAKRYSQEYMAAKLAVTQSTYSRLESDRIKVDIRKLKEISEILAVPFLSLI